MWFMRTARDLIDDLIAYCGQAASGNTLLMCKRAITEGLRELANARDWFCFKTWGRIVLNASYSTGTLAYDHTGGAYERLLTLSSGTWPTWAASGIVVISRVAYRVDERRSTTEITLRTETNPGADVAAGTAYAIYQQSYNL